MGPNDVSILSVLRQAISYHNDRQRVIADNVANANTPGFTPEDIPMSQFQREVERSTGSSVTPTPVQLSGTSGSHFGIQNNTGAREYRAERSPDSETTINGNSVVLEEQMVKANENRMRFESAMSLYQKSLSLIRMAVKPPGV